MTTSEVAERLRVDRWAIRQLVLAGKLHVAGRLPGQRGAMFFDRGDVEAFAEQQLAEAEARVEELRAAAAS